MCVNTRARVLLAVYVHTRTGNVTNCERPRSIHTLRALNSRRNEIIALHAEKGCRRSRSRPRRDDMPDRGGAHSKETNFVKLAFRIRRIPAEKRVSFRRCRATAMCHVVGGGDGDGGRSGGGDGGGGDGGGGDGGGGGGGG